MKMIFNFIEWLIKIIPQSLFKNIRREVSHEKRKQNIFGVFAEKQS